ncbi:DNA glycosylase AlkZ-like family protein [Cellulosimicrobium marinum]|uniref:DNA glycosylase AlkZ-like family protein n=1 Tax=Cellulosimicrobium marinum TaxID=1638992 RepID=UPI001E478F77|nr:crosslink repair DNA glycosylase YcaQ family protein [Cellulosimicrobium marinum]MCB7137441.1 winged helix DNA-binding domain-containing protein [Cellulosimicrobium marinum]
MSAPPRVSWPQALAWRLGRHLLDPVGDVAAADVVRRLGAVPAASDAALAVRSRQSPTRRDAAGPDEIPRALADGNLLAVYAFRGATHLVTPEDGGAYLALRAAGRMWERSSWREYYRLEPDDWPALRAAVRDALSSGPLTRAELGDAVARDPAYAHLRAAFADPSHTFLKPFGWQGDLSFGPSRGQEPTFQRLDTHPRWRPWPDLDEAGHHALLHYVGTYGPVTEANAHYWLGEGLGAGRARIRRWWAELADRFVEVDIDGEPRVVLHDDTESLAAAVPSTAVRLLPGHDQWVLGPGTADPHVVPAAHRQAVSRGANLVVAGGTVAGTWALAGDEAAITWFGDPAPSDTVSAEVARLGAALDRPLRAGARS